MTLTWDGPALTIENLSVPLGGRIVLDAVDLTATRGELLALVGPNGAGKTTLLRACLGLLRPVAGRVLVEGRATRPGRAPIGYVPQRHEFAWDFPVSVAGAVMTGLTRQIGMLRRPGREHWQAVAEALSRVRMSDLAERPVANLSGGQRQRVLVARALALRPTVLLLDEPFTGLDLPTQELLSRLFADLAHEGRAVVMTTHDLLGALDGADRIALLDRRLVAVGAPHDLAGDPAPWMSAFGVGADSALVKMLGAVAG